MPPTTGCQFPCECQRLIQEIHGAVVGHVDGSLGLAPALRQHLQWHAAEAETSRQIRRTVLDVARPGIKWIIGILFGAICAYATQILGMWGAP